MSLNRRQGWVVLVAAIAATVGSPDGMSHGKADPIDVTIARGAFPRTTSVLLIQRGRVRFERYYGGTDAETLHDPRSVGKSITALAVGIAIAEGKLTSVDAPAFSLLADLAPFQHDGAVKRAITIKDLLTMSSALACDDDDGASPGNERNMYPQAQWARWAVDLPVRADHRRDERGGGPFAYCTAGVFLLGQILQRATGQPVDRFIESRLLTPLGITKRRWVRSPADEVMTGGMLSLRTRDLARIAQLLLDSGRANGKAIVPDAWIESALSPQRKLNLAQDPRRELDYGYLFYRRRRPTPCGPMESWFMSGNGGNHVVIIKELAAIVVVTTVNYNTRGMHDQTTRLIDENLLPRLDCPGGRKKAEPVKRVGDHSSGSGVP